MRNGGHDGYITSVEAERARQTLAFIRTLPISVRAVGVTTAPYEYGLQHLV